MDRPNQPPSLVERDLRHIWHPCSQMKDYEKFLPLEVQSAQGSWITLKNGQKIFDAISSWWCKSLGHGHPHIAQAVRRQMENFEHVILANTTNDTIVQLSERLCQLSPNLNKVFYAGDGSSAVEIALKMSIHAQQLRGQPQRKVFMGLQNGYHGETALCLAVSDCGLYSQPYENMCPQAQILKNIPLVTGENDPLWHDCSERWPMLEEQLNEVESQLCAIIVEPIVQGAGGMLVYSSDFLKRLRQWTSSHGIDLIADEIMTGFGRTGTALACEHAGIEADMVCLSKGLTSGWMALSAVLCSNSTYQLFYDDYSSGKAFLHSNTYCGNALAAAAALASLEVYEQENIYSKTKLLQQTMISQLESVAQATGRLTNLRGIGGLVAADLVLEPEREGQRCGYAIYREAISRGALLRTLGNTIYWLPPLNSSDKDIEFLAQVTKDSIRKVL
jgi:adenosylmethionine---8-amino-7-oxononanoate aminotransferase